MEKECIRSLTTFEPTKDTALMSSSSQIAFTISWHQLDCEEHQLIGKTKSTMSGTEASKCNKLLPIEQQ